MSETWFHATTGGGRNGPMHADDLLRLFQAGRIDATTPVWREGMPDWVPDLIPARNRQPHPDPRCVEKDAR